MPYSFWCVEKTLRKILKANSLKVVAMSKQLMLMVLFNALICLLYVFFHVYLSTQSSYVAMEAFCLDAHGADPAFWTTHSELLYLAIRIINFGKPVLHHQAGKRQRVQNKAHRVPYSFLLRKENFTENLKSAKSRNNLNMGYKGLLSFALVESSLTLH